jgi:hypothetical protein
LSPSGSIRRQRRTPHLRDSGMRSRHRLRLRPSCSPTRGFRCHLYQPGMCKSSSFTHSLLLPCRSRAKPACSFLMRFRSNQAWYREVSFDIPADIPACPPGGCHVFWLWIHEISCPHPLPLQAVEAESLLVLFLLSPFSFSSRFFLSAPCLSVHLRRALRWRLEAVLPDCNASQGHQRCQHRPSP